MPHLEEIHRRRTVPRSSASAANPASPGEERLEPAVSHQQDDRVLVDVLAPPGPVGGGMQHRELHPSSVKRSPERAGCHGDRRPGRAALRNAAYAGSATGPPGSMTTPAGNRSSSAGHAAQMIGVGVGDDDRGQRADALPLEKRGHHPAARVAPARPRGPASMTIQRPPGVRSTAPSPCPTSRKCNARPRPPSGEPRTVPGHEAEPERQPRRSRRDGAPPPRPCSARP